MTKEEMRQQFQEANQMIVDLKMQTELAGGLNTVPEEEVERILSLFTYKQDGENE